MSWWQLILNWIKLYYGFILALMVLIILYLMVEKRKKRKKLEETSGISVNLEKYIKKGRGRPKKTEVESGYQFESDNDKDFINQLDNDVKKWMDIREKLLAKRAEKIRQNIMIKEDVSQIDAKIKLLNSMLKEAEFVHAKNNN